MTSPAQPAASTSRGRGLPPHTSAPQRKPGEVPRQSTSKGQLPAAADEPMDEGGTCESRCLESGVSTDPEPCGFARPRMAVRGFPVSGEKGILVVEPSPGGPARPVVSMGTQTSPDDLHLPSRSPSKPLRAAPKAPPPNRKVNAALPASAPEQEMSSPAQPAASTSRGRGLPPHTSAPQRKPGEVPKQSTSKGQLPATADEPMDEGDASCDSTTRWQTGGGGGRVRSLASSYAHILTLVGEDSALGAPGFSVPAFEDEAEGRPTGAQAGHGQQAAEPVPSTSRDVRPPARPRVRPTAPRATPRMSRQERHDEAAMQAVANQTRQVQQNETRDARDVEFQGQLLRSIDTLSHRMEAVAESNQEQARATQAVALELQNTTRVLVEVVLLLTAERSRALRSQDLPSPAQPPLQPSQVQPRPAEPRPAEPSPAEPSPAEPSPAEPSPTEHSRAQHR
ncbi:hypothetical protein ISCGN_002642 [Ixodes scapularis]